MDTPETDNNSSPSRVENGKGSDAAACSAEFLAYVDLLVDRWIDRGGASRRAYYEKYHPYPRNCCRNTIVEALKEIEELQLTIPLPPGTPDAGNEDNQSALGLMATDETSRYSEGSIPSAAPNPHNA